jgi:hypothetical protein
MVNPAFLLVKLHFYIHKESPLLTIVDGYILILWWFYDGILRGSDGRWLKHSCQGPGPRLEQHWSQADGPSGPGTDAKSESGE